MDTRQPEEVGCTADAGYGSQYAVETYGTIQVPVGGFKNSCISTPNGFWTFVTTECAATVVPSSLRAILETGTTPALAGRKGGDL